MGFERELEIFGTEVETAAQFLYGYLAVRTVAAKNPGVVDLLNDAPLFWRTTLGALQAGAFVTLGRLFDQKSSHNVDQLLRAAEREPEVFSKEQLGERKRRDGTGSFDWLDGYLADAYVPTPEDFRRLRRHVKKWRRVYESGYGDIRRKVFAHKELSDSADVNALFKKTNMRDFQRMVVFLLQLRDALWELLFNGRRPLLGPKRYSARRMHDLPSPWVGGSAVHERIVSQTKAQLVALANLSAEQRKRAPEEAQPGDRA